MRITKAQRREGDGIIGRHGLTQKAVRVADMYIYFPAPVRGVSRYKLVGFWCAVHSYVAGQVQSAAKEVQ